MFESQNKIHIRHHSCDSTNYDFVQYIITLHRKPFHQKIRQIQMPLSSFHFVSRHAAYSNRPALPSNCMFPFIIHQKVCHHFGFFIRLHFSISGLTRAELTRGSTNGARMYSLYNSFASASISPETGRQRRGRQRRGRRRRRKRRHRKNGWSRIASHLSQSVCALARARACTRAYNPEPVAASLQMYGVHAFRMAYVPAVIYDLEPHNTASLNSDPGPLGNQRGSCLCAYFIHCIAFYTQWQSTHARAHWDSGSRSIVL